jgi:hypothetical protein
MPIRHRARRTFAVASLLALRAASGHAEEQADEELREPPQPAEQAGEEPQAPPQQEQQPTLTQEWIGVELTPVSMSLASCCGGRSGTIDRYQAGYGAGIRFGRHRFEYAYVNPFAAGLYVTSQNRTILVHFEFEAGVIVPATDRRLELGAGFGLGYLSLSYGVGCDGSCNLGGGPGLFSLVARGLVVDQPKFTVGASVRAIIPMGVPEGESFAGYYTGPGYALLGGIELGYGRP